MNIVLIGMPGCGKTTLGGLLASELGREFFDSDEEIERRAGRAIPEMFAAEGEDYFRTLETACIEALLGKDGIVLSVGGGAVERNAKLLQKGFVIHIDREIDEILKTLAPGTRPLLEGGAREKLESLHARRAEMYARCRHARIENNGGINAALDAAKGVLP
ncbi:MAG: shikimate kinase [Oscillospiraceae bacterium]|jgi:shikimate kinase|nr:shikimate kinase [Oscillospiraceae bacterium]